MDVKEKKEKREKRKQRTRRNILGTAERPRLCVFRSGKHIYAQLINDEKSETLASASDLGLKKETKKGKGQKGKKKQKKGEKNSSSEIMARSFEVGKMIAEKAKGLNIKKVVFDRGLYKYHGRIKSLAEGAREGGLNF